MLIADITNAEASALTRILQLQPDENAVSYAGRVMSSISELDSHLKRPSRMSGLVLPLQKSLVPLCKSHKPLNAPIIHSLFNLVALEAGGRLNSLVSNNHRLSETERTRVQSLRELHSLWLKPEMYQKTFFELPNWTKWKYQDDGCEACMLARIGGEMPVLLNLRMALLSRISSKKMRTYGPPRLMMWVERWIASLSTGLRMSEQDFEDLIAANDRDGAQLKSIRKLLWHERRESRRQYDEQRAGQGSTQTSNVGYAAPEQPTIRVSAATTSTNPSNQSQIDDVSDTSDAENDIIDAYAALTSTPYLPSIASTISLPHRLEPFNPLSPPRDPIPSPISTPNSPPSISDRNPPTSQATPPKPSATGSSAPKAKVITKKLAHPARVSNHSISPCRGGIQPAASRYTDGPRISPADSYVPPRFPVHPAYIPPTAAERARRYQNLLSPDPREEGMKGSASEVLAEKEKMDPNQGPWDSEEGADSFNKRRPKPVSNATAIPASPLFPARPTTSSTDDADWYTIKSTSSDVSNISTSSIRRSQTTRETPSSAWSKLGRVSETSRYPHASSAASSKTSITPSSAYSSYVATARKPVPIPVAMMPPPTPAASSIYSAYEPDLNFSSRTSTLSVDQNASKTITTTAIPMTSPPFAGSACPSPAPSIRSRVSTVPLEPDWYAAADRSSGEQARPTQGQRQRQIQARSEVRAVSRSSTLRRELHGEESTRSMSSLSGSESSSRSRRSRRGRSRRDSAATDDTEAEGSVLYRLLREDVRKESPRRKGNGDGKEKGVAVGRSRSALMRNR